MAITEEQLKSMSPEEIQQLQKQQCIFCHIIAGKVQSRKIYEDETIIAILDINPANPGHVLLLPKEHYSILPLIPDDTVEYLFMASKAISQVLLKAMQAEGTNIFAANGVVAGQKAQHFMMHIIPRKEGDGVGLILPEMKISGEDMEKIRKAVKSKVDHIYGIAEEGEETEKKEIRMPAEPKIIEKKEKQNKEEKKEARQEEEKNREETEESNDEKEEETTKKTISKEEKNGKKEIDKKKSGKSEIDLDTLASMLSSPFDKNPKPSIKNTSEIFVASKKSSKFHAPDCPFVRLIREEQRIYFENIDDAKKAHEECECIGRLRDMQ